MNDMLYNQYRYNQTIDTSSEDRVVKFLERLMQFDNVNNLEDAQKLAKQILPTKEDITTFYVGSLKCIVVNRSNLLRISAITDSNVICYSFS